MNKAIFLDRDGTINKDTHYLYRTEEYEFLPGVVEAIRLMHQKGYLVVVITNQSGIARGKYTATDAERLHEYMRTELKRQGTDVNAVYYCPHLPDGIIPEYTCDCDCRKPHSGLFRQAIVDMDINPEFSYAVGDKVRDLIPGKKLGMKTALISDVMVDDEAVDMTYHGLLEFAQSLSTEGVALKPLLSVIVPIYKVEKYLERCVESILGQTYDNLEIILVDDGSPDGCPEMCDKFVEKDKRVKCIHKENGGLVNARKTGIKYAGGSYITYVDGDDWIDPEMYKKLMDEAIKYKADVVTSGLIKERSSGARSEHDLYQPGVYASEGERQQIYDTMLDRCNYQHFGVLPFVHTKLFRSELLRKHQMKVDERIKVGEDVACVYPLLLEAQRIVITDYHFYHYRIHNGSMTSGDKSSGEKEYMELVYLYEYLKKCFMVSINTASMLKQLTCYTVWAVISKFPQKLVNESNDRIWLFNNLYRGERIIVYGAGNFGADVAMGFKQSGLCKLIAWVDKDYINPWKQEREVEPVENIMKYDFDKIVIGTINESYIDEMRNNITKMGIPKEKITIPEIDVVSGNKIIYDLVVKS